jgi:flagellar basal-body rod modification protein FlgD
MTIAATSSLTQSAEQAARAAAIAASNSATATAAASATGTNALQALGSNFNQFLTLLTTQLKNQDPTAPTDTNQFTQELVQFTGVQQSVATNTNLTQLIQLQQGSQVLQSAQVVGHKATVSAGQIALQGGAGEIDFTTTASEPVQIAIVNSAGATLRDVTLTSQAGSNSWHWDGRDNAGNQLADGAYGVALETGTTNADATAVPFSVVGTATGLTNSANGLQLQLGALSVGLSNVQSISGN